MVEAIITHTDMDGVASAGVYLYLSGNPEHRLFFTEPYLLDRTLRKVLSAYYDKVLIFDLGVNPSIFNDVKSYLDQLVRNGSHVYWFDHHLWNSDWISDVESIGVKLYIDQSTCATGVVAKYVERRRADVDKDFLEKIVNGVCAGDLWRFDHWLGGYYLRLVRRRDRDDWRKHVVKTIASGRHWSSDFESKIIDHVESELSYLNERLQVHVKNHNGLKLAIAESNEIVENSFLASYLIGRFNADIAVLASMDGKLSFRSRGFNVRDLAVKLGGGGHMYASGAKIDIPWLIRLISRFNRKALLIYVGEIVSKAISKD